jgi:predicted acylesterase/phospholipase RssA
MVHRQPRLTALVIALTALLPAAAVSQAPQEPRPAAAREDVRVRIREAQKPAPASRSLEPEGADDRAARASEARAADATDRRLGLFQGAAGERYFPERQRLLAEDPARYQLERAAALARMEADASGPSALVASGGISLGSYEAGLLYYFTYAQAQWEVLRSRPLPATARSMPVDVVPRFSVATGASAGALNAFLAAVASCQTPTRNPNDSLFKSWIEIGWNDLLTGKSDANECRSFSGVLSREKIRQVMQQISAAWVDSPRWVDCDVQFGVMVSNLSPRNIPLSPGEPGDSSRIGVPRLTERFVFQLQGTKGKAPVLRALGGSETGLAGEFQPTLGVDRPGTDPGQRTIEELFPVLMATSGIPGFFDPVRLTFAFGPGKAPQQGCFIDGGVLDNIPLSTAIRLMRLRRPREQCPECIPPPPGQPEPSYFYLDPDNVEWLKPPQDGAPPETISSYGALLGGLVQGARKAELARAIEENPDDRRALRVPVRRHVITGDLLAAFGAFFDVNFRWFDFYAGMADAQRNLAGAAHYEDVKAAGLASVEAPGFDCFERVWAQAAAVDTAPECLALRNAPGSSPEAIRQRDLWRLLKVSVTTSDPQSDQLTRQFLQRLDQVEGAGDRGFEYTDLKLGGRVAARDEGLHAVRDQLQRLVRAVDGLPSNVVYQAALATAGTEFANATIGYRRVPASLSLGLFGRGVEVGGAVQLAHGPIDLAASLALADFKLGHGRPDPWELDTRAAVGARVEWALGSALQLLPGAYLVGQGGYRKGASALYRAGLGARLEAQGFQRFYGGLEWTWFPAAAAGWRSTDLSLVLGVRWWR